MMFPRKWTGCAGAVALVVQMMFGPAAAFADTFGTAVVPTNIIYPGETLSEDRIRVVDVTNPNLAGDYARQATDVLGMVSKSTLLPGRTIPVSSLRQPYAMTRGQTVRLTFNVGNMVISAAGSPLTDAIVGDVIRARNLDSGIIVSGTVMADGTIHVVAK
nr:flagellar basal body P-ring formation chaperone FlgA [uncultured Gellertiella sp.]